MLPLKAIHNARLLNLSLSRGFVLLVVMAATAWAVDANRQITQYAHTAWRIQDGFFERRAKRNCSDYGWLSMDWNEDWTHAFRWRPIRSMEADEWKGIVVILHCRTPRCARWESMDRNRFRVEPFGRWKSDPISWPPRRSPGNHATRQWRNLVLVLSNRRGRMGDMQSRRGANAMLLRKGQWSSAGRG